MDLIILVLDVVGFDMELKDKIAIITGGGSGMGAATARYLATQGVKVAVWDLNNAEQIAKEINGVGINCDVSDEKSVQAALKETINKLGMPSICVNCAGIVHGARLVGKESAMPLADFQKVININLVGTFNVMRLAAEVMSKADVINKEGERGVIINTASVAAFEGQIGQVAYSASKNGVVGMTLPAARELANFGIRVMCIAPGLIDTPMFDKLPPAAKESLAANVPFPKRLGNPSEFAELVAHIIENSYLNGGVIRLDAGVRLQAK